MAGLDVAAAILLLCLRRNSECPPKRECSDHRERVREHVVSRLGAMLEAWSRCGASSP